MSAQHTPVYGPNNPAPLRREGESIADYRVRCGWDAPKVAQHTSGPWHAGRPAFGYYHIYSDFTIRGEPCKSGRQAICTVPYEGKKGSSAYHEMFAANASLIAAAPELLDVVRRARRKMATYTAVYPGDKELLRLLGDWDAVIAKATGSAA